MIVNLLLFKTVWALSLLGVVIGHAWLGAAALTVFAGWHFYTANTPRADFAVAGVAVLVGLVLDTVLLRSGLIAYHGEMFWSGAAPLWILALWANFALTLNGCLGWLQQRHLVAATLALIFGPLSYYGGITLGTAVIKGDEVALYGTIGLTWAIAVPFLLSLSARFSEYFHPAPDTALEAR